MGFLDFSDGKGALNENFDLNSVLKKIDNDKFIQRSLIKLDDATIERILTSKKYVLGQSMIEDSLIDISYDFGTLNKDKGFECYFDLCAKNLIFYVIKNIVDGEEVLELCATSTLVNQAGGMSASLYYIPKGDFSNVCMIARVCHHQGTNDHKNSDGLIVDKNKLHIHLQSERYIKYVEEKYHNNPEKMLLSLQSPDAKILNKECKNVKQLADIATDIFGITHQQISFMAENKTQIYSEIKNNMPEMCM